MLSYSNEILNHGEGIMRVFITGTNRGIGLELVRCYLERGEQVFAACRKPEKASELKKLKSSYPDKLIILKLEVTNQEEIDAAAKAAEGVVDGLDLLINNAGMYVDDETLENITAGQLLDVFGVNAVAPVMVAQRFHRLLKAGEDPKLVNISSRMGSITRTTTGGEYSYTSSKAALNMFTRALAFDLRPNGITTVTLHPGWVLTDMGGEDATLSVQEAVGGIMRVIDNLTPNDIGRFLGWDGEELPW